MNTMSAVKAEQKQEGAIPLGVPGLGERLRSARMARDLDVSKMAERIHLTVDMVDSLEHDDYSEMPARVFVRGYIRSYARTVELPLDSVLAQFDAIWPDEDAPVTISPSPRLASDGQANKSWHRVMSWLLVLVMLVLFLTWWQGYLDRFIDTWREPSGDSVPAAPLQGSSLDEQPSGDGFLPLPAAMIGNENTRLSLAPAQVPATSAESDAPVPEREGSSGDRDARQSAAAAVEPGEPSRPAGLTLAADAEPRAERETRPAQAAAEEDPVASAEPAVEGVLVRFNQDCWVDIRDSARTFKLFGTMRGGSERKLEGTPPYKVVLGNASGVEISINGEAFDLASQTVNNVARFTLDP